MNSLESSTSDHPMVTSGLTLISEHVTNRVLIVAGVVALAGRLICSCRLGAACKDTGKHPLGLTPHGVWDATRNPATLRRWYAEHPEGNLAWAVGPDRLVVDEDGELGRSTLNNLELPRTRENATGRADGGRHLIYSTSRPCGNQGDLPGVDLKGVGGYVVVAPSRHYTGASYQTGDSHISGAPSWAETAAGVASADYAARWALADLSVPHRVRSLLHDDHDSENDVAKRRKNRDLYRDRSRIVWSIIWSLLNRRWSDDEIISLIRYGSSLHHGYGNQLDRRLKTDIAKAREQLALCPVKGMCSDDHVALADLHFRGTPTHRKVLRALQQKCAEQEEGRFTASRDDLAVMGSCSASSVTAAIEHLKDERWVARVSEPTPSRAAMYLLVLPRGVRLQDFDETNAHSLTPTHRSYRSERLVGVSQYATKAGTFDLNPSGDALRFGKGTLGKSYPLLRCMGTSTMTVAAIASRLGWKPDRVRRQLRELEGCGVVIRQGQLWALADDAPRSDRRNWP
jgi:hypothetical protein